MRHQHRIRCFNNHQVFKTHCRDQSAVGMDIGVARLPIHYVTLEHIAVVVLVTDLPERRPGADVAPPSVERYDHRVRGFFHHGVINRVIRAGRKSGFIDACEMHIARATRQGCSTSGQNVRAITFELLQVTFGVKHKQSAVPQVTAVGQVLARCVVVWFFHKALYAKTSRANGFAFFDIAVAGFRMAWNNPERHQFARLCQRQGCLNAGLKGGNIFNQVVSWQYQQEGICLLTARLQGRQRNGRRGIAADRLQQNIGLLKTQLAQLLGRYKAMLLVADQLRHRGIEPP